MKTSDEVPNTSGLSNIAVGTTGNTGTTLVLHPSGAATGDGAGYTGGTAATAMDSNDGDSSYGSSASSTNDFYVNLDNTSATGTITAVQISALASNAGGWSSTGFNVGLKTNGSTYLGGAQSSSSSSYSTYAGTSYATNPNTGIAWAWPDINTLIAAVAPPDVPPRALYTAPPAPLPPPFSSPYFSVPFPSPVLKFTVEYISATRRVFA